MKLKSLIAAVTVLACGTVIAACGSGASGASSEPAPDGMLSADVGVIGPRSGAANYYWEYMADAIEFAVPEIESKYGVRLNMVEVDDQGSPELAARGVQQLINEDDVDAILGPPLSGTALQVADTVQRSKVPWLLAGPTADDLVTDQHQPNWAFRTQYRDSDLMAVNGELVFADDAKVGVVYSADAYGQGNLEGLKAYAEANGETLVASEAIQPGASSFSSEVSRLKSAGVNVVYLGVTRGADISTVTRAMIQGGLQVDRVLSTGTVLIDFPEIAEPEQWENLVFVDPRPMVDGGGRELIDAFEAKTGRQMTPRFNGNFINAVVALDMYAAAVAKVGDASDREAVRQAIEDAPFVSIGGEQIEKPFSADDHELWSADPNMWRVYRLGGDEGLVQLGTAAECTERICR